MAKWIYGKYETNVKHSETISAVTNSQNFRRLTISVLSRVDPSTYAVISWVGHPAYTGGDTLNGWEIIGASVRYSGLSSNRYMKVDNYYDDASGIFLKGKIYTRNSTYSKGDYIGEVTAEEGTYPNNDRHTDGYWYVKDRLANTPPQISGSDLNLGSKTSDFNVDYIVTDTTENDTVGVKIYVNDILKETKKSISLGYKYIYTVKIDELSLGNHTVKIVATDSHNVTVERVYSFTKSNTAPVITSKQGTNLGEKNTAFSYVYQVYDANKDKVNVTISLNGVEFSNLSAVPQNEDLDFTIEDEVIYGLELSKINNITIKADDTKGGITYHRITFIRTNSPPIISGSDRDLGTKSVAFSTTISATDVEKDEIQLLVYIDDKEFKDLGVVVDNKAYTIQIDHDTFIELSPGKHTIKIVATDSKGASSERLLTFTRKVDELEVIFEINEMDIAATKVLFDALFKTITNREANLKIFGTNNYYDANPVWEDITGPSLKRLAYVFTNKTSAASKWGLAVKVTYKGEGTAIMTGMTGGYE